MPSTSRTYYAAAVLNFTALSAKLYVICHDALDENRRIQLARELHRDIVGAPPQTTEERAEALRVLNQQLQDELTAARKGLLDQAALQKKILDLEHKLKCDHEELELLRKATVSTERRLIRRILGRLSEIRGQVRELELYYERAQ